MHKFLYILFICFALIGNAKDIRIGLFESNPVKSLEIKYNIGRYDIFTESEQIGIFQNQGSSIKCYAVGNDVSTFVNGEKVSTSVWVRIDRRSELNSLALYPEGKEKKYRGSIVIYAKSGKLQVINEVDVDEYVQGVLKGEVGYGQNVEYYKVQAVISRTYSLYLQKHKEEGYDLCDHVHCQVYKGISYDENIKEAVLATSGEVIVDSALNYLNTLFHSNCGGQTVTTDYVWNKKLANLESIKDPHCLTTSNARWRKTISKDRWVRYLANKTNKSKEFVLAQKLDFNQAYRKKHYKFGGKKIRLTDIRSYFGLKSTFFSVHDIGEKIVLVGRGFGHGVGLCQQGAIEMSKKGYTYKDIIYFYYQNISVLNDYQRDFYLLF